MQNILFFSRSGYDQLFTKIQLDNYKSYHATLNKKEKRRVINKGGKCIACFEEEYEDLQGRKFSRTYLMNGFQPDRFMGWLSLEERRCILGKLIAFWRTTLQEYNIDAVVHETVSMEPEEVLSIEADRLGVKDLTFLPTVVDGWFFWKPNPYNSSFSREKLDESNPGDTTKAIAKQHIENILNHGHYPDYIDDKDSTYNPRRLKTYLWSAVWRGVKSYLSGFDKRNKRIIESLMYYDSYQNKRDTTFEKFIDTLYAKWGSYDNVENMVDRNFVFYPLHYEPEATLRYFSPILSNQLNVIDIISRFLPNDQYLIVKEHPSQPYYLLRQEYTRLYRRNSNVIYLPADVPSEELIQNCNAVVTISGTVGWEAAVYQKPIAVLGNVFYDKHPGVTNIKTIRGLRTTLRGNYESPSSKTKSINYLSKILDNSYRGNISPRHWDCKKNINKITNSIEMELRSI